MIAIAIRDETTVSHPLPRKGTETRFITCEVVRKVTPQRFTPITPQGDGNSPPALSTEIIPSEIVSHPLPRKGTETLCLSHMSLTCLSKLFHTHYPARGRKPAFNEHSFSEKLMVSHPLPRKGTETIPTQMPKFRWHERFTPITPQGDGNLTLSDV